MRTLALAFLLASLPLQAADRIPADVAKYIERRETCDHFRGEIPDPEDNERMQEVLRQLEKSCRGTDRQLAKLKKKYSKDAEVRSRLDDYEPRIESDATHEQK